MVGCIEVLQHLQTLTCGTLPEAAFVSTLTAEVAGDGSHVAGLDLLLIPCLKSKLKKYSYNLGNSFRL